MLGSLIHDGVLEHRREQVVFTCCGQITGDNLESSHPPSLGWKQKSLDLLLVEFDGSVPLDEVLVALFV